MLLLSKAAQHIVQNTAVLEITELVGCINAHLDGKGRLLTISPLGGNLQGFRVSVYCRNRKHFLPGKAERFGRFTVAKLQRQYTHPHEIRAVDTLVTFGQHRSQDRKSTRLNSSHVAISYAVFCLKKKSTS